MCFHFQFKYYMLQKELQSQEEQKRKQGTMTIENGTVDVMSAMFNNTASHGGIVETSLMWFDVLMLVIGIIAVVLNGLLLIAMVRYRPQFSRPNAPTL